MIDLGGELLAALRSTDGQTAVAEAVRAVVAAEVRAALAEQRECQLLDSRGLADYLGTTPAALRMRLRRGSDLAAIAVELDGKRAWRRADVEALIARGRGRR